MTADSSSFFDKVPAIIEASAKSPAGLAALIILVLGFLAYIYFREAKETTRTIVFLVMGIVGFLMLMAILSTLSKPVPNQDGKQPTTPAQPGNAGKGSGEARQPKVVIGTPVVTQGVATPRGPGISITVPGSIRDGQGQAAQLVVNFAFFNGTPVYANPSQSEFRTVDGMVATGTTVFQLQTGDFDLSGSPVYIPYYAFNMMPSGGYNRIDLMLTAAVYVNGVVMARSPAVSFYFFW